MVRNYRQKHCRKSKNYNRNYSSEVDFTKMSYIRHLNSQDAIENGVYELDLDYLLVKVKKKML